MRNDPGAGADELERRLRDGLRTLSESVAGEPPSAAALVRLVERVRREERHREARELAQFLACAAVVVSGGLLLLTQRPIYYLALQAVLALPLALGAVVWSGRRKRVME